MTLNSRKLLERDIEAHCCSWLKRQGFLPVRVAPTGVRGFPDVMVLDKNGTVFFIEFKRPDGRGKVSVHQKIWKKRLEDHSCFVGIIKNLPELERFIEKIC